MSCRFLHRANTIFCKQVKSLFDTIFADSGLKCKRWWKRCEYQKRGTVHIHGCFRLDCDPKIMKSTEIVLKVYITGFRINKYNGWEFIDCERISLPKNTNFLINQLLMTS